MPHDPCLHEEEEEMKRIVRLIVVLAAMVFALSVAAPAFAASGGTNRPFSASGSFVCDANGCSGSGNATHLGRFTTTQDDVFTAIGGDQIAISLDWSTVQVDFPGVAPCSPDGFGARIDGAITGGSGRFAHASGSIKYLACSSDEVHYTFYVRGTISY